jgi:hypothetical protein
MTVRLSPLAGAGWQLFTDNGTPLSGGLLYTYSAGTTTPLTTYTTSAGNVANANPIVLDAAGRVANQIWMTEGTFCKFVLRTSTGVEIWTKDNIQGINDIQAQLTAVKSEIKAEIFADLADTSDVAKGDALIGFKQANMAGVYAGAIGQTVHRKLQERVSVFDFMTTAQINDVQANMSLVDVRTAVNAAFAAVIGNGGGTLYFPKGTYYVSDQVGNMDYLAVTANINIQIEAEPGAVLNCNPSVYANTALYLRFQNLNVAIVKNLTINCNDKVSVGIFISGENQTQCVLVDNCQVNDAFGVDNPGATSSVFGIVAISDLGYACSITNCRVFNVRRAKAGLSCQAIGATGFITTWVENNTVFNVRHSDISGDRIDADGIVVFSYNDGTGRYYRPSAVTIINNRMVDCEGRFIKLQTQGSALVEGNNMNIINAIKLIDNFVFVDSQVGQATIINNKIESDSTWTGGSSASVCVLQSPTSANVADSYELFVQIFSNNQIYLQRVMAYGILPLFFKADVQTQLRMEICDNVFAYPISLATSTPGSSIAVSRFVYISSERPLPANVNGNLVWKISGNQVSSDDFIVLDGAQDDYTDKWWLYVHDNVKYGRNTFLIRNPGGGSTAFLFPYTSNSMIRGNQIGVDLTQICDLFVAPINSAKLLNDSDFSTGDGSAGTIAPAPANWNNGHFGRKGGVLFAETVVSTTAYRYISRDNGANWYQV